MKKIYAVGWGEFPGGVWGFILADEKGREVIIQHSYGHPYSDSVSFMGRELREGESIEIPDEVYESLFEDNQEQKKQKKSKPKRT